MIEKKLRLHIFRNKSIIKIYNRFVIACTADFSCAGRQLLYTISYKLNQIVQSIDIEIYYIF